MLIRTEDFVRGTHMLGYVTCAEWERAEGEALRNLVSAFSNEMTKKLLEKKKQGLGGWDDAEYAGLRELLQRKLEAHVLRGSGQNVDIANLAAMLWNLETSEAPEKEE